MKLKIGILGATGYTGAELLRLLASHPGVEVSWLTSEKFAGNKISLVFPHLRSFLDLECRSVSKLDDADKADLVFSCLPHGVSMRFVSRFLKSGARVIDFSRDFRFSDARTYKELFRIDHKYRDCLRAAVYGLPELNRHSIKDAALVANPGCYSTAVILSLAPLAKSGFIEVGPVIADIKAGLSGGGRAPGIGHHFPEANENLSLSISGRDQEPEMEQELSVLTGSPVQVTFVPHTVPMTRGILATTYCALKKSAASGSVYGLYEAQYSSESFVSLTGKGKLPGVKDVSYSNMCRIGLEVRDDMVVVLAVLDNLGKGASGQAIQNMNIMFGFPETEGLSGPAMFP